MEEILLSSFNRRENFPMPHGYQMPEPPYNLDREHGLCAQANWGK